LQQQFLYLRASRTSENETSRVHGLLVFAEPCF
jgi:hypothetical protein